MHPRCPYKPPPSRHKQVGIIRQAEVEFDNLLDQQRAKLKGQAADLRQWKKEAEKRAKEIEELDGEPSLEGLKLPIAW